MDVIITTNGPGEVSTWVRPVIARIRESLPSSRIVVFLTPCMFAGGREKEVLESFEGIDMVFTPRELISYRIIGKKPAGFIPGTPGIVISLGGDLLYARFLGKRLKYSIFAYCERPAGKPRNDFTYFVPDEEVLRRFVSKGIHKDRIFITDRLVNDAVLSDRTGSQMRIKTGIDESAFVLNIFPGSRMRLLEYSIPFFMEAIEKLNSEVTVVFTVAPYISFCQIEGLIKTEYESCLEYLDKETAKAAILGRDVIFYKGNQYDIMQMTDLALALPGSSNSELAVCGVPSMVVLPLNYPDRIPLPGVVEYICRIPVIGGYLKKRIVFYLIDNKFKFVSPVNREAGVEIFPEIVGVIKPVDITVKLIDTISYGLDEIREKLRSVKGSKGASGRLMKKIIDDMKGSS